MTNEVIHVVVECHNVQGNGESRPTNILRITFEINNAVEGEEKVIYPETLTESMKYIESMRRVEKYLAE